MVKIVAVGQFVPDHSFLYWICLGVVTSLNDWITVITSSGMLLLEQRMVDLMVVNFLQSKLLRERYAIKENIYHTVR